MSCGHIALDRAGINVENYFASEIKEKAIAVTKFNYPDTIQLGDVTKIETSDLPKIDLMIGGSPCFTAGTKIFTKDGYKNIEDINKNDYVLTHKNRFKKVIDFGYSIDKEVFTLKASGILLLEVTGNHPFYARTMSRKWNSQNNKYERIFSEPYWKNAEDLDTNDFIAVNILPEPNRNDFNLTADECWLLGRYLADGHLRNDKRKNRKNSFYYSVIYSVGNDKVEDFKKRISEYHLTCYPHSDSCHRICVNSEKLVKFIKKQGFGEGAQNKRIPYFIYELPNNLAEEFLNGYLTGDGYKDKNNRFYASSVSKELILGINLLVTKLYKTPSNNYVLNPPKTKLLEGRLVNQNTVYSTAFYKISQKQNHAVKIGDCMFYPFRSLELKGHDTVYNISVEDDESYTANNAIVHNCQDLSIGMNNRKGLQGNKSILFWEYIRILKEIKPKYFLLENVASMDAENRNIISKTLGVEPIRINSSLVSAQLRDRLYWSNIPNIKPPEDKGILLQDILESGYTDRKKARALLVSDSRPLKSKDKMWHRYKNTGFTTIVYESKDMDIANIRYFTQIELERLQTVPVGYTQILKRDEAADVLGDGWTVDVIAHIFKHIV